MPLATIQERVATLEERVKALDSSHGLRNGIIFVVIAAFLGWMGYITVSVVAMKQQLADGGNKQLVSELKSPKSPEQLRANLATVVAQVQTARANHAKPNTAKLEALSGAVSQVLKKDDSLPEGWQAAGQLISYRTQVSTSPNLGYCVSRPWTQTFQTGSDDEDASKLPQGAFRVSEIKFHDCTLVLDDVSSFENSDADRWAMRATPRKKVVVLELYNVHVVYRGGAVVPVDSVLFSDCTFEFQTLSPPPATGQQLTKSLLAAADLRSVSVELSDSRAPA